MRKVRKLFLLIIVFTSLVFGQEIKKTSSDSSFISTSLIKGIPIPLTNNDYFFNSEKSSFAVVYHNQNDWIYFISKQLSADSSSYILVLTSKGVFIRYSLITLREIGKYKLYGTGKIEKPNGKTVKVELYYFPGDNLISYKVVPISKTATRSNVHFEFGIRDEFITMYGYFFNQKIVNSSIPINLHLATGIGFLKHYKADFRFGLNLVSEELDFGGWDAGIYLLYDLFNTDIFANAGLDYFDVFKFAHGSASGGGSDIFYCFGLGFNLSNNLEFDIMYDIPNRKKYGNDDVRGPYLVDGLLKIGFQYSFIF